MDDAQVMAALQGWFEKRLGHEVSPDASFFKDSGLDSFDALNFISFVETTFSIRLEADDLQSPSFATLRGVAALVEARRQNTR